MLRGTKVLALTFMLFATACFGPKGARVVNPAAIPAASSAEATEEIILEALPKKGWTAETVEDGRIVAFLPVRTHLLRVQIKYDDREVQVGYLDSNNLNETRKDDGTVYAHKKVNGWMQGLARELNTAIATRGASTSGGSN